MAIEIERKFLVRGDGWREGASDGHQLQQGYFPMDDLCSVRVRVEQGRASLNIKSRTLGVRRSEYEYAIPLTDAEEMLAHFCQRPLIEKTRYRVPYRGHTWEVDVFSGENAGLVIAEVELQSAGEALALPDWVGTEVSDDVRYYNVCLIKHPYTEWAHAQEKG